MDESASPNAVQLPFMEVFSYSGTSQYTAGEPSACILASVNAALLVLSLFHNELDTQEALGTIRSQDFVEVRRHAHSLFDRNPHERIENYGDMFPLDTRRTS